MIAMAGASAACNTALQTFCPSIIVGPIDGCTVGVNGIDIDCDGIPDVLDECTPATVATNPRCNGNVLPISTTNNQTIFHILDKGESAGNSLEVGFQVQNADVYFLMDMSDTMGEERDALVNGMTTGNFVECALLKNCCDRLTGSAKTVVRQHGQGRQSDQLQERRSRGVRSDTRDLVNCPDLDFDGLPDNQLKTQGVVGAMRCLVGSSWFGAGTFIELPFRDGVNYTSTGRYRQQRLSAIAATRTRTRSGISST